MRSKILPARSEHHKRPTFFSVKAWLRECEAAQLEEENTEATFSSKAVIKPNRLPRGINSIILGTVYHPPQNDDNKLRAHLFSSLDSALASYPNSAIVVLGDFNQFKPGNLCSSFKLKRLVTKPTRGNKILDQAYSTMSHYYDEALILPPVGLSDHSSVLLQPSNYHAPSLPATRVLKRDCKASNRQALLSFLQAVTTTCTECSCKAGDWIKANRTYYAHTTKSPLVTR